MQFLHCPSAARDRTPAQSYLDNAVCKLAVDSLRGEVLEQLDRRYRAEVEVALGVERRRAILEARKRVRSFASHSSSILCAVCGLRLR
jgi:hypothetical protein